MDQIFGIFLVLGIMVIAFLLIPAVYGRTGGYRELVSEFKAERPEMSSATYQRICVERGYGAFHDFTGVNFFFNDSGIYIFPMFRLWSWSMPTLFLPYSRIEVRKVRSFFVLNRTEICISGSSLPKITIPGKFFEVIKNEVKIT